MLESWYATDSTDVALLLAFTSFLFWPFPFSFSSLLLFSNGSVVCLLDADTVTYVRMELLYYSFSWEMQRRMKERAGKKGLDLFLCNFSCLSFILSVSLSPHIFAYNIHTLWVICLLLCMLLYVSAAGDNEFHFRSGRERRYIRIIQIFWWCRTGWISRNK